MTTLKEKMKTMEEEMQTFSDVEKLRVTAAERREKLELEKDSLADRKKAVGENLAEMEEKVNSVKVRCKSARKIAQEKLKKTKEQLMCVHARESVQWTTDISITLGQDFNAISVRCSYPLLPKSPSKLQI